VTQWSIITRFTIINWTNQSRHYFVTRRKRCARTYACTYADSISTVIGRQAFIPTEAVIFQIFSQARDSSGFAAVCNQRVYARIFSFPVAFQGLLLPFNNTCRRNRVVSKRSESGTSKVDHFRSIIASRLIESWSICSVEESFIIARLLIVFARMEFISCYPLIRTAGTIISWQSLRWILQSIWFGVSSLRSLLPVKNLPEMTDGTISPADPERHSKLEDPSILSDLWLLTLEMLREHSGADGLQKQMHDPR